MTSTEQQSRQSTPGSQFTASDIRERFTFAPSDDGASSIRMRRRSSPDDRKLRSSRTALKLSDLGISRDQSSRWQRLAESPEKDNDSRSNIAARQELL